MALPTFIKNATGLDDGAASKIASQISKIRDAKKLVNGKLSNVEGLLGSLDNNNLPNVPSVGDISTQANVVESAALSKLNDLNGLDELTGGCLSSALSAAKSIGGDSFGLLGDSLDQFGALAGMPTEMFGIFTSYASMGSLLGGLGIDKLIADINSKLGCLSDSSLISDVQSEIATLTGELGLDGDGKTNETTFYDKMKGDLSLLGGEYGLDVSFTDSMADGLDVMTKKSNELSETAKTASSDKIKAAKAKVKASIPKTPTPSTFF